MEEDCGGGQGLTKGCGGQGKNMLQQMRNMQVDVKNHK